MKSKSNKLTPKQELKKLKDTIMFNSIEEIQKHLNRITIKHQRNRKNLNTRPMSKKILGTVSKKTKTRMRKFNRDEFLNTIFNIQSYKRELGWVISDISRKYSNNTGKVMQALADMITSMDSTDYSRDDFMRYSDLGKASVNKSLAQLVKAKILVITNKNRKSTEQAIYRLA